MTGRSALVTGATGQDGTYLVAELVANGYTVIAATHDLGDAESVAGAEDVARIRLDVTDAAAIADAIREHRPDVIFNLAARSSGQGMFEDPLAIVDINGLAVTRFLEVMRLHAPSARLCQASSSEVFGTAEESPQNESARRTPRSPYGAAKQYADSMIRLYRESFGMFACSAILFNHESPLRRPEFVTRKVTRSAAAIRLGLQAKLTLGNLEARRDWGYAGDYMRAMRLMSEAARPCDYVVSTGVTHSVRDLCDSAFSHLGLNYLEHVHSDPTNARPAETTQLVGDSTRAARELGWSPRVSFEAMIQMMVDQDLKQLRITM